MSSSLVPGHTLGRVSHEEVQNRWEPLGANEKPPLFMTGQDEYDIRWHQMGKFNDSRQFSRLEIDIRAFQ
ncbi:hypothetical protein CLU79DRAFT_741191 [Phycomyces nitens]|nr:hypothetical protein CLU79DRAFT_741191 [Phycomyces nitens]